MSLEQVRVLVVDDQPLIRDGVAALLEKSGLTVVAEAGNGREAIEECRRHRPEIVLMDLRMPEVDGVEATASILREFPETKIIILTTYDGDEDIYRALQAGAHSYLLKGMTRDQLIETIRYVHSGRRSIPPLVADRLAEREPGSSLTRREVDILRLVAAGKSNKEIAAELSISEGTVKGHVNSILAKLGASHRTHAVVLALHRGILHP